MPFVELRNVRARDVLLGRCPIEDGGAVARAAIRTLPFELRRIMGHRKVQCEQLTIGDLLRIKRDLHGLRVTGRLAADHLVMRGRPFAAGVARDDFPYPLHVLEHPLHSPETSTRQYGY